VLGIVVGFASGYRAGQGAIAGVAEPASGQSPTTGAASPVQPFSESSVSEPVRLDPPPIIPEEDPTAGPAPPPPAAPPAVRRVPATAAERPAPVEPAPTGPGSLQVVSRPTGAQVFLDGRSVGRTPLVLSEVAAGSHTVRLELAGFNGWATSVNVKGATRVAASLEQP
jgi:hypothetical protein